MEALILMTVHVLNGDALSDRFPNAIIGKRIVARECLVDGYRSLEELDVFFEKRAEFIASYPPCTKDDYIKGSIPEFNKILNLPQATDITLWFEEDLFCQTNLWFVVYLLNKAKVNQYVHLLKPCKGCEYSFSGMSDEELCQAFDNRMHLSQNEIELLAELWCAYASFDGQKLKILSQGLTPRLSFINKAIDAELAREPDESGYGKPERMLLEIIQAKKLENLSTGFPEVFREFCSISGIYSFGDLQVKKMYDQIMRDLV